jgi:hypothetical protein
MPSLDWDWKDVDLGSLPAWLGAFSLLLAYRIFRTDRTNAERAQVDLIGAWAEPAGTWREFLSYEVSTQPYISAMRVSSPSRSRCSRTRSTQRGWSARHT